MSWYNDTPSSSDAIIDVRKVTQRVDELREQRTPRIVAGWNSPGEDRESKISGLPARRRPPTCLATGSGRHPVRRLFVQALRHSHREERNHG